MRRHAGFYFSVSALFAYEGVLNLLLLTSRVMFCSLMWCNVQKCVNVLGGQRSLSATGHTLWSLCGCSSVWLFFCSVWMNLGLKTVLINISATHNELKWGFLDVIVSKCGEERPPVGQTCSWCAAVHTVIICCVKHICVQINETEGNILYPLTSPHSVFYVCVSVSQFRQTHWITIRTDDIIKHMRDVMKRYLTSVFLLWGENKKQRNQTESRKRVRELLQHRPQISSALSFSLDASELIWSCGRWKLLQPQKCNTTVDVWTPDARFFHFALALAPFTLCFTARLMFLKHFIKGYLS